MRRQSILVVLTVALAMLSGCAKRRAFDQVLDASQRWFVRAWGTEFTAEHRAREERRLECLWGGLEARGVEPVADFECLARRTSAAADCQRSTEPSVARECIETAWESGCKPSAAFEEISKTDCLPAQH